MLDAEWVNPLCPRLAAGHATCHSGGEQGGPFPLASRVTLEGPATVGTAAAEIRKLSDLLEVRQTLSSTLNLKSALTRVVELLKERHGLLNTSVVLLDPD